jgi:hypothetical protein
MTGTSPRHLAARAVVAVVLSVGIATAAAASPVAAQSETAAPGTSTAPVALPEGITQRMAQRIAEVIDAVGPIRALEPTSEVPFRIVDRDTFAAELGAIFREEYTPEHLAAEDAFLTRMGFIEADDDLEELMLSLLESQVLAYYDPRTGAFTIVGPVERIGALEEVVVAHEFAHALQDQRWDLEGTRITDLSRSDEILAQQSLTEGDATAVMFDWAARELDLGDLLGIAGSAFTRQDARLMRRIPPILRRQLESPYLDGFAFVNALRGRGDWAAVDDAWEARPRSTEQILHPDLYPDEEPIAIELPDVAAAMSPGWTAPYAQTLGEMQIGVWVADGREGQTLLPGLPAPLPRAEAAEGWGGDRLLSLEGPDGAWAVVWQTAWDSGRDAREFSDAAVAAMRDLDGASDVLAASIVADLSDPVLVLVADSRSTLQKVRTALGLEE